MTTAISEIPIIDVDTHVVEPPDLWTSRLPSSMHDDLPQVRWDDRTQDEGWFLRDMRLSAVGGPAMAGWHEYPPYHPRRWEDTDPVTWDAKLRLKRMDEYGVQAQVLYPNVALFDAGSILSLQSNKTQLALVETYNDWQIEWGSVAPDRYIAIASLPFWDLDATLAEIDRCVEIGHRGITFSQDPSAFGLPDLTDAHWYPMWASLQEKGLSVNFHIASGDMTLLKNPGNPANGKHANYASMGVSFFMGNARTLALLTCGGICHRFPDLKFVSVESGIGWIPFALGALDWQWKNCGVPLEHPEYDLLPSEYFKRQIYGCFWFETDTVKAAIEILGADNILYETDFPHPTSMSPGPATSAIRPDDFIRENFSDLPADVANKILHDNAAKLYGLD